MNVSNTQVSGPINIVRLESNFNGIHKVVYVFLDYHESLQSQTQCASVFSNHIVQYFSKNLMELNDTNMIVDFFCEIRPTELHSDIDNIHENQKLNPVYSLADYLDIYLHEIWKFFIKIFKYNGDDNRVYISDIFKNVRLHYIDIRQYFQKNFFMLIANLSALISQINANNINTVDLDYVVYYIQGYKENYENLIDNLNNIDNILKQPIPLHNTKSNIISKIDVLKQSEMEYQNAQVKLIYKITSKYHHKQVQTRLHKCLADLIRDINDNIDNIDTALKYIDQQIVDHGDLIDASRHELIYNSKTKLYQYGNDTYEMANIALKTSNYVKVIQTNYIRCFSRLMDIYFIRRFLDKDYITNAIIYTGATHSINYIYILCKQFDFKVTHVSYSKILDISELNTKILESTNYLQLGEYFFPPIIQQCSDLKNFPTGFK